MNKSLMCSEVRDHSDTKERLTYLLVQSRLLVEYLVHYEEITALHHTGIGLCKYYFQYYQH